MYTVTNFKTKKALKMALAAGQAIDFYQPGPFADKGKVQDGTIYLAGPHYPAPHTWYAQAEVVGGKIVKVK